VLGVWGFAAPDTAFSRAHAFTQRALSINDRLAEAHLDLAFLTLLNRRDRRAAEREFQLAFDLGLRNPVVHGWYAIYLIDQGLMEDAIKHSDEGLLMDPLSPMVHTVAAAAHLSAGYKEKASALFARALELDPNSPVAHHLLGLCYMMMGQDLLAEESLRRGAQSGVSNSLALLAALHMRGGRRQEVLNLMTEMERLSGYRWIPAFDRAIVHVVLANEARSLELVDEALAHGEPIIILTLGHFMRGVLPDDWLDEVKRRTAAALPHRPRAVAAETPAHRSR
jgi:tetratricopeptide (TPR) repeat protein